MMEQTQRRKRKFFGIFSLLSEIISWVVFAKVRPYIKLTDWSFKNSLTVFVMELRPAKEINADKVHQYDIKMF